MADVKISDMTPGSAPTGAELMEAVQSGGTVSLTTAQLATLAQVSPQFRKLRIVTAAGAITVTTADYLVIVNKSVGAASAVALPAGALGQVFVIKDGKGDAGANNITITPAAGTIDGGATLVISSNYGKATLIYSGVQWNVL